MRALRNLPRISVVMPNFNGAKYLEKAVESVLSQDYPNLDFIVADGGSSDGSVEIIKKYEGRLAYWHSRFDRGQSDAINIGLARARGEILTYLNSDDCYLPGALEWVGRQFELRPECDVLYGRCIPVDEKGAVLCSLRDSWRRELDKGFRRRRLLWLGPNYIQQPAAFWRRRVTEVIGGMDLSLNLMMDYDYWLRAIRASFRFEYTARDLALFRCHSAGKTSSASWGAKKRDLKVVCGRAKVCLTLQWLYWRFEHLALGRLRNWRIVTRGAGLFGLLRYLYIHASGHFASRSSRALGVPPRRES